MNHIHPLRATWPLRRHKKEYLLRDGAERLLVPNRNYVLIRRFSAKEETRRLKELTKDTKCGLVFVTAFPDFAEFPKAH